MPKDELPNVSPEVKAILTRFTNEAFYVNGDSAMSDRAIYSTTLYIATCDIKM